MILFPRDEKIYLSFDSILKFYEGIGVQIDWITTGFLNDIRLSGLPAHRLVLKKGILVMVMRNWAMSFGLCNGTRLIIQELEINTIGAIIVTGTNIGSKVYIPRSNLISSIRTTHSKFQRHQFPLMVWFTMTINKVNEKV